MTWRGMAWVVILSGAACGSPDDPDVTPGDQDFIRDPALDVENVSAHGTSRSHNVGMNCMNCHQERGPGRGRFTVAGTLRNRDGSPHPNGTVHLTRVDPNTLGEDPIEDAVATVEADALGNFYSTQPLPLPEEPLYVVVERSDGGGRNFMPWSTLSAACNVCHVGRNPAAVKD